MVSRYMSVLCVRAMNMYDSKRSKRCLNVKVAGKSTGLSNLAEATGTLVTTNNFGPFWAVFLGSFKAF
jgi:hypothetical protein